MQRPIGGIARHIAPVAPARDRITVFGEDIFRVEALVRNRDEPLERRRGVAPFSNDASNAGPNADCTASARVRSACARPRAGSPLPVDCAARRLLPSPMAQVSRLESIA